MPGAPWLLRGQAGLHYRCKDLCIAGAAAKISGKSFANFGFGGMRVALQEIERGENHARSADTTLRAAMGKEGLLHGVQAALVACRELTFDGADFCALRLQRGDQTAVYQHAVDFDRAGAAFAFAAAFFCAGEVGCSRNTSSRRAIG